MIDSAKIAKLCNKIADAVVECTAGGDVDRDRCQWIMWRLDEIKNLTWTPSLETKPSSCGTRGAEVLTMAMDDNMQTFRTKVRTNGDKIRAMTDEELAEWLDCETETGCNVCSKHPTQCDVDCYSGYLEWLKQETQEDADDMQT